jgi:L-ascorbate metabolism protein UlaG (beta-lactamase superfamily)
MKLTWYGTATIILDIEGEKLLFDPFFRLNKRLESTQIDTLSNVDFIFNTHPHFDHLCDVPKILQQTSAKIYGSRTMLKRLEEKGVDTLEKVELLDYGNSMQTRQAKVISHRSQHVKNDIPIILKTLARIIFKCQIKQARYILGIHNNFRMGGDIAAFEVQTQGKKVLIFGSAGIDEGSDLPKDVDVLVWPFQGRTGMTRYSMPIIERINPKIVILDHFDDAFPPITGRVFTKRFVKVMKKRHPKTKVIVPKYGETIEL